MDEEENEKESVQRQQKRKDFTPKKEEERDKNKVFIKEEDGNKMSYFGHIFCDYCVVK